MSQKQYRRQRRRPDRQGPHLLLRERRAAEARSDRPHDHLPAERRRRSTRGWPPSDIRASRSTTGIYPNPVNSTNLLGKVDHQFSGRDQLTFRYSLYDITSENARGAGGLNAPSASAGLDNVDQTVAVSNTLDAVAAHGERDARAVHLQRPQGAADRSGRSRSEHRRRRHVRHAVGQPTAAANTMFQVVDSLSHQRGAHALRAGVDFLYNGDTITYPALVPRRLHVLVARELPGRHLQQRRIHADVRRSRCRTRPTRTSASTRRTSGRRGSSLTFNLGVRYDLQLLETIRPTPTTCRRASGSPGRRSSRDAPSSAAAPASSSIACRCGRWPTRCCPPATRPTSPTLQQIGVSLSPTQAGAPVFPDILAAPVPSVTLPT